MGSKYYRFLTRAGLCFLILSMISIGACTRVQSLPETAPAPRIDFSALPPETSKTGHSTSAVQQAPIAQAAAAVINDPWSPPAMPAIASRNGGTFFLDEPPEPPEIPGIAQDDTPTEKANAPASPKYDECKIVKIYDNYISVAIKRNNDNALLVSLKLPERYDSLEKIVRYIGNERFESVNYYPRQDKTPVVIAELIRSGEVECMFQ